MKYVYDKERGIMVEKDTGMPMLNQAERALPPQCPRVEGDYEGYRSPVTGEWIEGKRARRYDLEKHGAIDARDFKKKPGLKNERFIKKRGLERFAQ